MAVNEKSGQREDKNKAHTKGEPLLTVNDDYEPDEGDNGDIDFLLASYTVVSVAKAELLLTVKNGYELKNEEVGDKAENAYEEEEKGNA